MEQQPDTDRPDRRLDLEGRHPDLLGCRGCQECLECLECLVCPEYLGCPVLEGLRDLLVLRAALRRSSREKGSDSQASRHNLSYRSRSWEDRRRLDLGPRRPRRLE